MRRGVERRADDRGARARSVRAADVGESVAVPLEVLYANSVDALARELADRLRDEIADDPLVSPLVVVPGRALSAVVERRVAERLGVAMSVRRVGARSLWERVAETAELALVEPRALAATILEMAPRSPALSDVLRYLDAAPASARGKRGVEVALSLAELLLDDDRERPGHIDAWLRGQRVPGAPAWQGELLCELFSSDGVARTRSLVLPSRAVAATVARGGQLPERAALFCPAPPSPGELDNLRRLAHDARVTAYVMSPCRGFWEDYSADDPRLLAALGRAGRVATRAWNLLADHSTDDVHVERAATSVLRALQAATLERARADAPTPAPDRSLTLHDCPSPAREIEIVKAIVLDAISGPGAMTPPLRPDQVSILVPERLTDEYLPRLARVLASPPALPFTVVGRRLVETSPEAAAARALLALPAEEITRDSVLRVLCHEGVRARGADAPAARLRALARRLGVYRGADGRALVDTDVELDLYHWDQALSRLSLGFFADATPDIVDHGRGPWLTFPVAAEDEGAAAALVDGARRLLSDAARLSQASLPLTDWAAALAAYLDTYLADDDRDAGRGAALEACAGLAALDVDARPVDFSVAATWVAGALDELEDPGGEPLFQGVLVGALGTVAAAPARLSVLVGALESALPRAPVRHPLDVGAAPRPRELSQADRDRHHVLTRASDAERLAVTWVGRDPSSGEPVSPSPVVGDLRAALGELGGPDLAAAVTRAHPESRADLEEHDDAASRPRAVQLEANMAAIARALRDAGEPPRSIAELASRVTPSDLDRLERLLSVPRAPSPGTTTKRVTLSLLRRFVESPVEPAAQWVAGASEHDDEESEPLEGDGLLRTALLRPALLRADGDAQRARALRDGAYLRRELAGTAPTGFFGTRERAAQDALLDAWAAAGDLSEFAELVLGAGRPDGERLVRRAAVRLGDWEITGAAPAMTRGLGQSVAFTTSKTPSPRHALGAAVSLTVLAAAGEELPSSHLTRLIAGEGPVEYEFATPERSDAEAWLTELLDDLASGPPPYTVSFDAAATAREKRCSLASAVAAGQRSASFEPRGPLARAGLGPPDDDAGEALMRRRFDFLLDRLRVRNDLPAASPPPAAAPIPSSPRPPRARARAKKGAQ